MNVTFRRILAEKRAWIGPIAVGLLVNVGVYALVVYPLSVTVDNARARVTDARDELLAARRDSANAEAVKVAHAQATGALDEFYADVLPRDLTTANRITYLRLAQLARELNLRAQRRSFEPEDPDRNSVLGRLKITMALEGTYEDMREFIYEIEVAPDFVVIEDIALSEGGNTGSPLVLTLALSTYYQVPTGTDDGL